MNVRATLRDLFRFFILHKADKPPYRPVQPLPPPINGVPQIPPFEPRGELAVIEGEPLGTGMWEAEELRRAEELRQVEAQSAKG